MKHSSLALLGGMALLVSAAGVAMGLYFVPRPAPDPVPSHDPDPDFRNVFPGTDEDLAEEINGMFNVAMDVVEGVDRSELEDQIEYLVGCAVDDAREEFFRRWSIGMIGHVLLEAHLPRSLADRLGGALIDVIHERHGLASPPLKCTARAVILSCNLDIDEDFHSAVDHVENDEVVLLHMSGRGLEFGWPPR